MELRIDFFSSLLLLLLLVPCACAFDNSIFHINMLRLEKKRKVRADGSGVGGHHQKVTVKTER